MTHTLVASATRQHIIGFDRPFTVIGERINPTGRKKLAAEMQAGNFETVIKDALAQVAAGAHILDINAGVTAVNPNETEPPLMKQTLEIVQSLVDLPLCIDSSVTSALKMGLETAIGRPLVNSVTGEEEKLEAILPLVAKYNVPVVAISNDETGISEDPDVRFAVAKKIVERAADFGQVFDAQAEHGVEHQERIDRHCRVPMGRRIVGVGVVRVVVEGQGAERDTVRFSHRAPPVVHESLADAEVFVSVATPSQLGFGHQACHGVLGRSHRSVSIRR